MKPFAAIILPLRSDAHPDNTLPGQQPHPDNTLPGDIPRPEHPIYYPLPPGAPVHPDQGLPGEQPQPDQGLPGSQPQPDQGLPSHPIVLPPDSGGWEPVYIWGPTDPRPGTGLPAPQPHPDQGLPPIPEPPADAKIKWHAMWTPVTGWISFATVVPGSGATTPTPSKKK